jgi:hypothetical protein
LEKIMLVQILLIANLIACGEEDSKDIPPPPVEIEETKKAEQKPEVKTEDGKDATADGKDDAADGKDDAADGKDDAADGTAPEVKTESKKITSGEVAAAKSGDLMAKAKQRLSTRAQKEGFNGVKDIKLVKQECKEGKCTGLAQATAYKTIVTYKEGNAVAVAQEDKSNKNAVITKIEADKYTVKYDDASEATVEKSALSVRK